MARRSPKKSAKAKPAKAAKRGAKPAAKGAKGKWVYAFGGGKAEGKPGMRELLGGKGANLAEMTSIGLPVPPGFTITTEVCDLYYKRNHRRLTDRTTPNVAHIARKTGKKFGDQANPLLVSVRSGARASMPGMMNTILNLGLNDEAVGGWPTPPATSASPTTPIAA